MALTLSHRCSKMTKKKLKGGKEIAEIIRDTKEKKEEGRV